MPARKLLQLLPPWLENYQAFQETQNASLQDIAFVIAAQCIAGVCFFAYFTCRRWHNPAAFSPKRLRKPPDMPRPQEGVLKWAWFLLRFRESDFLDYAGFDALVYIRFYVLTAKICITVSFYCWLVILPINISGGYYKVSNSEINDFNRFSISNVYPGSHRLWAHVVGVYLLTFVSFFFLNGEFRTWTRLRHMYQKRRAPHMRTVLLEDLPKDMRSNARLYLYFNTLYPNSVLTVSCTQELGLLKQLLSQREDVLARLERAMLARDQTGTSPKMWTGRLPCTGRKVDALEYLTGKLQMLNTEVRCEQARKLEFFKRMDERIGRAAGLQSMRFEELVKEHEESAIECYLRRLQATGTDYLDRWMPPPAFEEGGDGRVVPTYGNDVSGDAVSLDVSAPSGMGNGGAGGGSGGGDAGGKPFRPSGGGRAAVRSAVGSTAGGSDGESDRSPKEKIWVYNGDMAIEADSDVEAGGQWQCAGTGPVSKRNGNGHGSNAGAGTVMPSGSSGGRGGGRGGGSRGDGGGGRKGTSPGSARNGEHGPRSAGIAGSRSPGSARNGGHRPRSTGSAGSVGRGARSASAVAGLSPARAGGRFRSVEGVRPRVRGRSASPTGRSPARRMFLGRSPLRLGGLGGSGSMDLCSDGTGHRSMCDSPMREQFESEVIVLTTCANELTFRLAQLSADLTGSSALQNGKDGRDGSMNCGDLGGGGGGRGGGGAAENSGKVKVEAKGMAPKAYVTFKTFSAATVARQVHHTPTAGRLKAVEACEPRDVYWNNTYVTKRTRLLRRLFVDAFLALLYVFYIVPVTLIYLRFSYDAILAHNPTLAKWCGNSSLFAALVDSVQPFFLLCLMSTLPPLIRVLGMVEGVGSESRNQKLGLSRYFSFQVINVFLVSTIEGSMLETVQLIINNPTMTFTLLGESLPQVCGFFSNLITIRLVGGLWIEMVRGLAVIQHWILLLIWPGKTPRDRAAVVMGLRPYHDAGWLNYSKMYAQDLLVVVVTLTYACINPWILFVSCLYFVCAHITYKHQLLYVYEPVYENGGAFFPKVFRRFVFAIFVAQATMVGVLVLKEGYKQAISTGALMVATYLFKRRQRDAYEPVSLSLPLEIATSLDLEEVGIDDKSASDAYLQPELKADLEATPQLDPATFGLPVAEAAAAWGGNGGGGMDRETKGRRGDSPAEDGLREPAPVGGRRCLRRHTTGYQVF